MKPAPVAVFAYRRPKHLQKVLEALSQEPEAPDTTLVLFLDGTKSGADQRDVVSVRAVAAQAKGFRSLQIHAAEKNLGLARSITEGVSKMCRDFKQSIILEDDIVPRQGFLSFMNEALEKYRDEPRVMQISGYAYPLYPAPTAHGFLPLTSCWGWATWQRAWQKYGWDREAAISDLENPDFVRAFDLEGAYPYSRLLWDVLEGKSDSWGVIWYWNVFRNRGLGLFPAWSLVENIGWDGTGEHAVPVWKGRAAAGQLHGQGAWPAEVRPDEPTLHAITEMLKGMAGHLSADRHRS
jgi:hypothetical protein